MTRTGSQGRPSFEERTESVFDWMTDHMSALAMGAGAVVILGVGGYLYSRSRDANRLRADDTLRRAELALSSGNAALAQSDLEKMVKRYEGTPAATQGTLLLATLMYERGQYQQGIDALNKVASKGDPFMRAAVQNLVAAGYEQMGKAADAAAQYRKAAELTPFEADRANYEANAARAFGAAGNTVEAAKIWTKLAEDARSPNAAEARIRLGEIQAKAAARS